MVETGIKRFETWRDPEDRDVADIIGASRQISHLSGVTLEPKGRIKRDGSSVAAKFSIRPRPLKWPGSNAWNRACIIIKNEGGVISFIALVDGSPVNLGPGIHWQPVRKAMHVMEKIHDKLTKEE